MSLPETIGSRPGCGTDAEIGISEIDGRLSSFEVQIAHGALPCMHAMHWWDVGALPFVAQDEMLILFQTCQRWKEETGWVVDWPPQFFAEDLCSECVLRIRDSNDVGAEPKLPTRYCTNLPKVPLWQ
jgi:hypothetical protein